MNLVNRVVVTLLALVLLVAAGLVLLVALGLVRPEQLPLGPWIQDGLAVLARRERPEWQWAIGIGLGLLALSLLLLLLELRPRREAAPLTIKQNGAGRVTVARDGVRELVTREASRVTGVMEARSHVEERANGLHILCHLSVDPTASVPQLSQEVQERIKAAIEHHLGRHVTKVSVQTQLAPLAGRRSVPRVR